MLKKFSIIREILKRKNAQIRAEREKLMAAEVTNQIYASYILCLASDAGEARISKARIADTVGKYKADISATEDEYIIRVKPVESADNRVCGEKAAGKGDQNGATPDKTGGEGFAEK